MPKKRWSSKRFYMIFKWGP